MSSVRVARVIIRSNGSLMMSAVPMSRVQRVDFVALDRASSAGHAQAAGILLSAGAAEVSLERRFTLRPGELYVIPAGAPHAFHGALEACTAGWVFCLDEDFNRLPTRNTVVPLDEQAATALDAWLHKIDIEQRSANACSFAMREALHRAIHIECARAMGIARCADHSRVVEKALRIISTDYAGTLRPRDVAERVGVTAAHLSHELKRSTDRSPSEWIAHARIEAAKQKLVSSSDSVSAIAEAIGYADVSQLNRQFRQATGIAPGAWRRANRARYCAK
jgi:AraC-like DNA-binding protein